MRWIASTPRRLLLSALLGVTLGAAVAPALVAEAALHIVDRSRPDPEDADSIARGSGSTWEPARVTSFDGVALDAWLFTPREPDGTAVILLHGVGDTRIGMFSHALYLLRAGFTVLLPDLRGHGASGGRLITYGIRESADVHAWADYLLGRRTVSHLYGLGQSLGAAILIESLPREPRFRAIVADCPFDTFEDVASYRLAQASHLGRWAAWPLVETGLLYARAVYRLDLRQASPAAAIRTTTVPVLLIHGTADDHIPPEESVALHALNPQFTSLWLVQGAGHISSLSAERHEYPRRVIEWFRSHP